MVFGTHKPSNPIYHCERNLFAWSLFAGLILFAALAGPFFAGRIYSRNDLGAFHLPIRAFYARQIARGEAFDWMPQIFAGFYLSGEGQAGTYHPLHLLLYDPRMGRDSGLQGNNCAGSYVSSWPDLMLAKFIGLFLGGAQLMPTIDALVHSSRHTADAAFASMGSLHPFNDIQGLIPRDESWSEAPNPLPRVRLVSRTIASEDPGADINKIDIETEALTDVPLLFSSAKTGSDALVDDRPGCISIRTDAPAAQLLVVAESYHPGWKATVNGAPGQTYRINGDYLGCVVGPGTQLVTLEFRPASLRTGRLISYLGLGFLPFCFLGIWFKPTISHPEEPGS